MKKKSNLLIIIIIIIVITICIIVLFINKNKKTKGNSLVNPLIETKVGSIITENQNINLEDYFYNYKNKKTTKGDIIDLSIYYRNLNNGSRFGIEEKAMFSPASLMKLPLLLAYYKKSEEEKDFLSQKILFEVDEDVYNYRQNIPVEKRLQKGKEYTLQELLKHMIKYSDNEVSLLLEEIIGFDNFKKVFTDIGIGFPAMIDGSFDNNIRVSDYSSFFRVLYNASYLNEQNSQEVLNLLTKTTFNDGLVFGVSENIMVSHKFGERTIFGNNGIERIQLHDCGIVYYPQHPYILCIMTRGYDRNKLKHVLQEVSKIIYDKVDETYKKNLY